MLGGFIRQSFLPRTAFYGQYRTIFAKSVSKLKRRRRAARYERRQKALNDRDWPIVIGDEVFVVNKDVRVSKELLINSNINLMFKESHNGISKYGEMGKILEIIKTEDCVVVEGVEKKKSELIDVFTGQYKHTEPVETPVAYSRIYLLDPTDNLPTLTKYMYEEETREKYRVSIRSDEVIDYPVDDFETHELDTIPELVEENTFENESFSLGARLEELQKETKIRKERRREINKRLTSENTGYLEFIAKRQQKKKKKLHPNSKQYLMDESELKRVKERSNLVNKESN